MDERTIGESDKNFRFADTESGSETGGENGGETGRRRRRTRPEDSSATTPETGRTPDSPSSENKVSVSKNSGILLTPDGKEINIPTPIFPVSEEKKQRKPRATKAGFDKTTESNIRTLIEVGFGFAAKIANDDIWSVTEEEATTVSEPLTRIMQRLGVNESMNKYADYIGLTVALSVIVIPRALVTYNTKEVKKKNERNTGTAQKPISSANTSNPSVNPPIYPSNIKSILDVGV